MKEALRRLYFGLKTTAYVGLGIMLCSSLLGPEGIAKFLKVKDPSEKGLEYIEILIPKYVLYWTLGTVILEVIGNAYSFLKFTNYKDIPLTKTEFNKAKFDRYTEEFKTNMRIAKIEAKLKHFDEKEWEFIKSAIFQDMTSKKEVKLNSVNGHYVCEKQHSIKEVEPYTFKCDICKKIYTGPYLVV